MTATNVATHEDAPPEIAHLEAQIAALKAQVHRSQRLAAMGTMAAMVAHEFNNILTPIINYAQMARRRPALAEKALTRAAEGGQRASDICHAILGFTRDAPAQDEPVALAQLVQDSLQAMARPPERDMIELIIDVPDDLVAQTRRTELQQVLLNLLLNARTAVLKRTAPRRITVTGRREDDAIVLSVADSGIGIRGDHLERIFQPFYTTRTGEDGAAGHGLGLTISRDIMAGLGGSISAASTPGQGATFTLRLPA